MIDVDEVIESVPMFDKFASVDDLHHLVETLDGRPGDWEVVVAGESARGVPIHHVRFGRGRVRALVVGGPHAMEPIGSLTVHTLLTLLGQTNSTLAQADVEWHIVPCIDPDGALLNEGWTQAPQFAFDRYLRNFYTQPRPDQVDFSFPIAHKRLRFDRLSQEAAVLRDLLDRVAPSFYFTLHNSRAVGGAWFAASHDVGPQHLERLHELLVRHRIRLSEKAPPYLRQFGPGIREMPTMRGLYDYYEEVGIPIPEELWNGKLGAGSYEYLLDRQPDALVFVAELNYGRHPSELSTTPTAHNLRQLKLRLDADNKFLASVIIDEWHSLHEALDRSSPFFSKIERELIRGAQRLELGVTEWYASPIHELLFTRSDDRLATEHDVLEAYIARMHFLCNAYSFVRLLNESSQTDAVREASERIEGLFSEAVDTAIREARLDLFEAIDHRTLAQVQLGAGLVALNSLLERSSQLPTQAQRPARA